MSESLIRVALKSGTTRVQGTFPFSTPFWNVLFNLAPDLLTRYTVAHDKTHHNLCENMSELQIRSQFQTLMFPPDSHWVHPVVSLGTKRFDTIEALCTTHIGQFGPSLFLHVALTPSTVNTMEVEDIFGITPLTDKHTYHQHISTNNNITGNESESESTTTQMSDIRLPPLAPQPPTPTAGMTSQASSQTQTTGEQQSAERRYKSPFIALWPGPERSRSSRHPYLSQDEHLDATISRVMLLDVSLQILVDHCIYDYHSGLARDDASRAFVTQQEYINATFTQLKNLIAGLASGFNGSLHDDTETLALEPVSDHQLGLRGGEAPQQGSTVASSSSTVAPHLRRRCLRIGTSSGAGANEKLYRLLTKHPIVVTILSLIGFGFVLPGLVDQVKPLQASLTTTTTSPGSPFDWQSQPMTDLEPGATAPTLLIHALGRDGHDIIREYIANEITQLSATPVILERFRSTLNSRCNQSEARSVHRSTDQEPTNTIDVNAALDIAVEFLNDPINLVIRTCLKSVDYVHRLANNYELSQVKELESYAYDIQSSTSDDSDPLSAFNLSSPFSTEEVTMGSHQGENPPMPFVVSPLERKIRVDLDQSSMVFLRVIDIDLVNAAIGLIDLHTNALHTQQQHGTTPLEDPSPQVMSLTMQPPSMTGSRDENNPAHLPVPSLNQGAVQPVGPPQAHLGKYIDITQFKLLLGNVIAEHSRKILSQYIHILYSAASPGVDHNQAPRVHLPHLVHRTPELEAFIRQRILGEPLQTCLHTLKRILQNLLSTKPSGTIDTSKASFRQKVSIFSSAIDILLHVGFTIQSVQGDDSRDMDHSPLTNALPYQEPGEDNTSPQTRLAPPSIVNQAQISRLIQVLDKVITITAPTPAQRVCLDLLPQPSSASPAAGEMEMGDNGNDTETSNEVNALTAHTSNARWVDRHSCLFDRNASDSQYDRLQQSVPSDTTKAASGMNSHVRNVGENDDDDGMSDDGDDLLLLRSVIAEKSKSLRGLVKNGRMVSKVEAEQLLESSKKTYRYAVIRIDLGPLQNTRQNGKIKPAPKSTSNIVVQGIFHTAEHYRELFHWLQSYMIPTAIRVQASSSEVPSPGDADLAANSSPIPVFLFPNPLLMMSPGKFLTYDHGIRRGVGALPSQPTHSHQGSDLVSSIRQFDEIDLVTTQSWEHGSLNASRDKTQQESMYNRNNYISISQMRLAPSCHLRLVTQMKGWDTTNVGLFQSYHCYMDSNRSVAPTPLGLPPSPDQIDGVCIGGVWYYTSILDLPRTAQNIPSIVRMGTSPPTISPPRGELQTQHSRSSTEQTSRVPPRHGPSGQIGSRSQRPRPGAARNGRPKNPWGGSGGYSLKD